MEGPPGKLYPPKRLPGCTDDGDVTALSGESAYAIRISRTCVAGMGIGGIGSVGYAGDPSAYLADNDDCDETAIALSLQVHPPHGQPLLDLFADPTFPPAIVCAVRSSDAPTGGITTSLCCLDVCWCGLFWFAAGI